MAGLIRSYGRFPRASALARMGLVVAMASALSGCFFATIESQGYVPDEGAVDRVKPGQQNRDDVAQLELCRPFVRPAFKLGPEFRDDIRRRVDPVW